MDKLSKEEQVIVIELSDKFGDIFYAMIGQNAINGVDLKTSVWLCYNKLTDKING